MFEFPIVTASAAVLGIALALLCLAYFLASHAVNWVLNQEEWGGSIMKPRWLYQKVVYLFCKAVLRSESGGHVTLNNRSYHLLTVKDGEGVNYFYFKGYWSYLTDKIQSDYRPDRAEYRKYFFKSEEEAMEWAKVNNLELRFHPAWALVFPVLDAFLFALSIEPFITISTAITVGSVLSVRWLSGRLARNVKRTQNHEERISELEESKDATN